MQKKQGTIEEFRVINENAYLASGNDDKCKHKRLVEFEIIEESGEYKATCYTCPRCGTVIKNIDNYKIGDVEWIIN